MLTPKTTTIDLGRIPFGKKIGFKYELKNEGTEKVDIKRVSVGCTSCTKAHVPTNVLLPGQDTTVNVDFTPGSIGAQKKNIYITWNEDKVVKLEFTAESYEQS